MMHGVLKRIFNSFCSCKAISGRILLAWCFVQVSICADSDDGWEVVIHERATGINSSSGDELRSVAAAADSYFGGFFGWRIGEVEIEPPTPTGTTCTNLDNTIFIDGTLSVLVNSTAGVSLTRATFSSFGIGLELTAKQAGLNWLWAGTLYMESNFELQPSVQHFSMWIRARGIGLLPFPMCHATTMSRVFWTLLGFDILSANVSSIVGISGPGKDRNYQTPAPPSYPLAPSPPPYPLAPTWDQGTRRLLTNVHQKSRRGGKEIEEHPFKVKNSERADRRLYTQEPGLNTYAMPLTISGELDVIDIQLNIQTTDPTATVEKMDKYMALESTKFLVLAYAATWAVNLHDYKLLNATVSKGWVNRTRGVVTTLVWGDDAFKTSLAPGPGPSTGPLQIFPAASGKGSDFLQIVGAGASGGGNLGLGAYLGIALAALAVVVVLVAAGVLGRRFWMRNLQGLEIKKSSPTASPEVLDLWRISRDDIEICRRTDGSQWLLGTGAYGKILSPLLANIWYRVALVASNFRR